MDAHGTLQNENKLNLPILVEKKNIKQPTRMSK